MKTTLSPEQAFQKIKQYCAYQERSHSETKEKLYAMGLFKNDVELLLSRLIEENYLNEERFASLFAGGHFRLKKWGRLKISAALQQKRISSYNIRKALNEIDADAYLACLQQLASIKWNSLKTEQWLTRMGKTSNYLLQKGYEPKLVQETIARLRNSNKE